MLILEENFKRHLAILYQCTIFIYTVYYIFIKGTLCNFLFKFNIMTEYIMNQSAKKSYPESLWYANNKCLYFKPVRMKPAMRSPTVVCTGLRRGRGEMAL